MQRREFSRCLVGLPISAWVQIQTCMVWANWKMQVIVNHLEKLYITKVGRLVAIKSTKALVPVCLLSPMVIPTSIFEEMEHIMRNFHSWKKRYHLLSYKVCIPIERDDLVISRLRDIYVSLLCKWLWKLRNEEQKLWKRIFFDKYGKEACGWVMKSCTKVQGYAFWKSILLHKEVFEEHVTFIVGNGEGVKFWENRWIRKEALKSKFPALYKVSQRKHYMIN